MAPGSEVFTGEIFGGDSLGMLGGCPVRGLFRGMLFKGIFREISTEECPGKLSRVDVSGFHAGLYAYKSLRVTV